MARKVALLADDPENRYQQLLVREARATAGRLGVDLLPPEFAGGSSWAQVESVNRLLRDSAPDGVLVMLAEGLVTRGPFERMAKAGVAGVFLNRIPFWLEDLKRDHPAVLVGAVTPDQEAIGRIQGEQAARLALPGAFVLLVTGAISSPPAVSRRSGFLKAVGTRFAVDEIDGHWSAAAADRALADWFRFRVGTDRERLPSLVVCQNDAMASGVRKAIVRRVADGGPKDLLRTPLIGCDGLEEEGKAMVARGELAATVVMPPTTPAALDTLDAFWQSRSRAGTVLLNASSYPPLATLGSSA